LGNETIDSILSEMKKELQTMTVEEAFETAIIDASTYMFVRLSSRVGS